MRRILLSTSMISLLTAAPALAQTPADAGVQVGDVIVTAQKRDENLLRAPISVSVVSAQAINDAGARNLTQLNGVVPGITFSGNASLGISPISIRGTSGTAAFLEDDPVAVYVDGVYQSSGFFSSNALADVAAVEVVRGPQGTLQGRNATAGAVLVRTADPGEQLGGYVQATTASFGYYRAQGAMGGPIADGLKVRLSLDGYTNQGWATNVFSGQHLGGGFGASARLVVIAEPSSRARLRLALAYQDIFERPALARWAVTPISPPPGPAVPAGTQTPGVPLSLTQMNDILDGHRLNQDIPTRSRSKSPSGVAQFNYDFGGVELVSVTGVSSYTNAGTTDSDGLAFQDREGYNIAKLSGHNYSEELRLQSAGEGAFSWILGGIASQTISLADFSIYNLGFTVPIRQRLNPHARQENPAYAAFGDVTWKLTDEWALAGGVRYTEESKTFSLLRQVLFVPSDAPVAPALVYNPPKRTWSDTSYRAKVSYTPSSDLLIYGSYSKGFKSGGFNAFSNDAPFDPETLLSSELGLKARFWDRRATLATSVYNNDYKNLQVNSGVPTGGFVIKNAASARISGFETEGELALTDHLRFTGNVAYIDASYRSFLNAPNILNVPVNASGNRLTRAPEWQYFTQVSYRTDIGEDWSADAKVSYKWRDQIYFAATDQNLSTFSSPSVGELGARLTFTHEPSDLAVTFYGSNLTDERVVNNESITFSYPLASFNDPRTFGVQLEKHF
jgi:iron complex outermembrane receptor protein